MAECSDIMSGRVAPTLENEKSLLVGEIFIDTADEDCLGRQLLQNLQQFRQTVRIDCQRKL